MATWKHKAIRCLPKPMRRGVAAYMARKSARIGFPPEIIRTAACSGGTAIDIGANIGVVTMECERWFSSVVSFEPNPDVFATLKSLALQNTRVEQIALSDRAGTLPLRIPLKKQGLDHGYATLRNSETEEEMHAIPVTVSTLDEQAITGVRFIKIDVEGFEHEVLLGAQETVQSQRPIMLIEIVDTQRDTSPELTVDLLENWGYRLRGVLTDSLAESHLRPSSAPGIAVNWLAIPIEEYDSCIERICQAGVTTHTP